ncbi:MAG: HAMP domain-containing protein [Alphaproteobacteria bacterium]|nr:MAG: HAMP domain-containing protein [Alphaproteobacteria bacterium]
MRFFHVAISIVAVLLFVMTFVVFLQSDVLDKRSRLFNLVLYADIAVFSIVFTILVRQLVLLFMKRRKNLAGSRLHSRIVFIMGIISVTPPIVVAAMLWFVFNESIQTWFSNRVSTALSQSTAVAEGYFEEHKNVIRYSAEALALDLAADWENLRKNPEVLQNVLNAQASLRSLNEAIIFNPESVVLARSYLTLSLDLFWVTKEDIHKAKDEVVLFTKDRTDRVRAMVRIHPDDNFYLLVGRYVDSTILSRIQEVHDAKSEYSNFQNRVGQIQITFTIIFGTLTVAVLLLSVWVGLGFAGQIVGPISAVIQGAERAGSGDLNARLSVVTTEPDIQLLANTFNAMLSSLQSQRKELLDSQALSDKRRRLIQAVLKSISTGVVTLDAQNHTTMINPRAREILNMREKESEGVKLDDCIPDVSVLLKQARVQGYIQRQISPIINGELHQLLVSVSKIAGRKGHDDLVMTLDDITLLVHAQKQEAWSDVARRIAHEIKNPLTPIQLSAERIKRRYPPQDPDEKEIFDRCINTIVRQVDHIGRLVSEFSSYAKMPQPQYQLVQTIALLKDIVLFNTEDVHANSTLSFETVNEAGTVISEKTAAHITGLWQCDPDQISQVLRNLIKNAQESVTENSPHNGNILLRACVSHDGLTIEVHDNGRGFPVGPIERLLDPYVTHKEKGTGLGLAIVHKIVVDHEGKLTLLPSALLGGACVRITIPKHMFRTTTEV